jgi:hypothetical protein
MTLTEWGKQFKDVVPVEYSNYRVRLLDTKSKEFIGFSDDFSKSDILLIFGIDDKKNGFNLFNDTLAIYKWNPDINNARMFTSKNGLELYSINVDDCKLVYTENINNSYSPTDKDSPIQDITIRDLYAILHNKPVSFKPWLNDLIHKNDD